MFGISLFGAEKRGIGKFRALTPIEKIELFFAPPNFQKHFLGRFGESQRLAREKAWKSCFLGTNIPVCAEKQDRRQVSSSQDFVRGWGAFLPHVRGKVSCEA